MRATARRDRLHLGAPGAPAAEAGQERVDGAGHAGPAPGGAGRPGGPAAPARRVTANPQGSTGGTPMQSVAGAGVVVTGGGSGTAAAEVARSCGGTAAPGDAASVDGVAALITTAREVLGEIDLFCANAGVARGDGGQDSEADWAACWQVNVMAHVRAARLLLPRWLERGNGHLICTVSAAGLLTMLGAASYSATKHAALAFAEWLAASYAHRGITVQALCPMGVRTAMLDGTSPAAEIILGDTAITAEEV